jgi:hypothetical protein
MTPPDSAFDLGIKAVHWLNPLVYIVGVAVGAWAYWLSRKLGYLVVTAYFLLVVCSVFIGPAINRMIATRWDTQRQSEISPQAHEQFIKEYSALLQKYYPPGNSAPATININFPFGPIILVSGLWMLARRESRRNTKQDGPTTGSQPFHSE